MGKDYTKYLKKSVQVPKTGLDIHLVTINSGWVKLRLGKPAHTARANDSGVLQEAGSTQCFFFKYLGWQLDSIH